MVKIKIVKGVFGHRPIDKNGKPGYPEPKTAADPPFEVDETQAKRLVGLGVAAFDDDAPVEAVATLVEDTDEGEGGSNTSEDEEGAEGKDDDESGKDDDGTGENDGPPEHPTYSVDDKPEVLRALLKLCGLSAPVGTTKAAMVEALDAYYKGGESDNEPPPELSPGGPVT